MPTAYPAQTSYALRPGVTCVVTPAAAVLLNPPHKQKLTGLSPAQLGVCRTLNMGPATAADLAVSDPAAGALVDDLVAGGWLAVTVRDAERPRYSIVPFGRPPPRPDPPRGSVTLSEFTVLHRDSEGLVLEHPLAWCDLRIHDPRLLALLDGPVPAGSADFSDVAAGFVADLCWGGFLAAGDERASFESASWSAPELWFHRRSTLGERVITWEHFGPTRWAGERFPQPPARRPDHPGTPVPLFAPDLAVRRAQDPTLTAVVEDRVSTRAFDDARPITADQLGELLHRAARTRTAPAAGPGGQLLSRPYPSAGGVYELEIYPVLRNVAGLSPGMYHYDSFDHRLCPVAGADSPAVSQLLQPASATLSEGAEPQVLLVIAARCGRIMWTYEQIGYASVLKDVGVLMQTVYLVATAMGLGVCAQGFGDTAAFAAAAGVDERVECSVGSIIVGSTPAV